MKPLTKRLVIILIGVFILGMVGLACLGTQICNFSDSCLVVFSGALDLLTLCGLVFVCYQIKDAQDARLEQATIEFLRKILKDEHPKWEEIYSEHEGSTPIPEEVCKKDKKLYRKAEEIFATLEFLAVGVRAEIYCPKITTKLMGEIFLRLNHKFQHFLKEEQKQRRYTEFSILCKEIKKLQENHLH
jgi:hypothetical protein